VTEFTENVITVIKQIPKGKVMTYGSIASYAGNRYGARQVVRILNSSSISYNLPWHRVINSKGEIGLSGEGGAMQRQKLEAEGVEFKDGKIDLSKYSHKFVLE